MAAAHQQQTYPAASGKFLVASILSFVAGLLILISFASPYWLESYHETYQSFIRMGLWEFCFTSFRYPRYQFDYKFDGCNYVFSEEYRIIREWLQPGWLMFVQAMMCVSLIFSLIGLIVLSVVLMRFFIKYEWCFIGASAILQLITAFPTFLAVAVFGDKCQERSWIMYPLYNHPSWAYGLAVVAFFFNCFAAIILFLETRDSMERKRRMHTFVTERQSPYRY